jgi:hypothetical protein
VASATWRARGSVWAMEGASGVGLDRSYISVSQQLLISI